MMTPTQAQQYGYLTLAIEQLERAKRFVATGKDYKAGPLLQAAVRHAKAAAQAIPDSGSEPRSG